MQRYKKGEFRAPSKNRILFIINPYAGKGTSKKKAQKLIDIFEADGWDVTLYLTVARGDATEKIKRVAAGYDRIVCLGGDGTLNEVISGVMALDKTIPVGYIPAGSTNDLGSSIGLPKNNFRAARIISRGEVREHDIASWNDRMFVYIASFGAFTEVSWGTPQKIKRLLGHMAYVFCGVRSFFKIKTYTVKVETDHKTFEGKYVFCGAANTLQTGGVYRFKQSEVNMSDGLLEVILVRKPEAPHEVPGLLGRLISRRYDNFDVTFVHTEKAVFSFPNGDCPIWTLDGERADANGTVEINCIHGRVNLIY